MAFTLSCDRQLEGIFPVHNSDSGLKLQAGGLFRKESLASPPSCPAHCASTALLRVLRSDCVKVLSGLSIKASQSHTNPISVPIISLPGSPTMIPSKS